MTKLQRQQLYKSIERWRNADGTTADIIMDLECFIDAKIKEAIQPIQCAALGHDFNKNSFAEEIGKCKRCNYDSGR